jgi:phosphoglycerol transferase MdoB-like AlkP superfamily enzyme
MSISEVLLISAAVVTSIVQLMKKTVGLEKIKDWIEWVALVLGVVVFFVYCKAEGLDVSIWGALSNGLIVGLSSIGLYQATGTVPGVKNLVK